MPGGDEKAMNVAVSKCQPPATLSISTSLPPHRTSEDRTYLHDTPFIPTLTHDRCPGLNTAANHGFLARDGITTFNELVDAQQNVYNVGHDLSLLLAFLGLQADGDLVTTRLSISCDATTRTSINPVLTGSQPGLAGHNKFEADSSLTRGDFFPTGDNFSFNRTLFDMMTATTGGNFDLQGLAVYREERWYQSQAENPNFFFGPLSLLLFGAASFLYELFPSGTRGYAPDLPTISSFFLNERLPENWTNRIEPYSNRLVTEQILAMYFLAPVPFGGNVGPGTFVPLNWRDVIENGTIATDIQPEAAVCLLYMLATQSVPSTLNGLVTPTVEALSFLATRVAPSFDNLGCPRPLT